MCYNIGLNFIYCLLFLKNLEIEYIPFKLSCVFKRSVSSVTFLLTTYFFFKISNIVFSGLYIINWLDWHKSGLINMCIFFNFY